MPPENRTGLIKTCALATGLTTSEVLKIALTGPKRYKIYTIPKKSGGRRVICHPSRELKALQYVFLEHILKSLPVHEAATAYRTGLSIKDNARAHAESRVILKLDFTNFFPSIVVKDWNLYVEALRPDWSDTDRIFSALVLFWGAGGPRPSCLSIGAPTSPLISNAIMYEFDDNFSRFCRENCLIYTRYADDITISSKEFLNDTAVVGEIERLLSVMAYPKLSLNPKKTRLASKAGSRRVTGLVLANDGSVSLGRERKRLIRSMIHHVISGSSDPSTEDHLAGLLAFAGDIEPEFVNDLARKYGSEALNLVKLRLRHR